ncbi:hypothetical protein ACWEFJ_36650 [Actinosynnema sp. NPDC004786]
MSRRTGLPATWLWTPALLGVPRVVAHDLRLVGPAVNAVLVFAPLVIWVAVALWRRVPNPFVTLLAVGVCHGVLLAATHQLLWTQALADVPPPVFGEAVLRIAAALSSLVTGTAVGAAAGVVAWLVARLVPAFRTRRREEGS